MADSLIRQYSVPSDVIDSSRLRFVVRAMHEVAVHWEAMGHQLQLKIDNLEKIKQDFVTVNRCLIAMADSLLKGRFIDQPGTPATWRTIVEVVHAPAGGNHPMHAKSVAGKLREFQTFCPGFIAKNVDATSFFDADLDPKKMVEVISAKLVNAAARWFEIGALLGLPLNTLTTIKDENHPAATDRMRRVIAEWLNQAEMLELEPPSWQVLVDVVAHGAGGDDPELAKKLASKSKEKTAISQRPVHGGGVPRGASQAASGYSGNGQPPAASSAESIAEHQTQATHAPPPVTHVEPVPAAAQGEQQTTDNQQNSVLHSSQQKHSQQAPAAAQPTDIADCYNMPKLNRGVVLIIVNVNFTVLSKRVGAENHAEMLKSCWEKLGYSTIITKEDLTADDIMKEFKKSAKLASDDKYHSFVCCISSHGSTGGISGTDDNGDKDKTDGKVKIEQLTKFLAEDEVKNLRNKPKMFFIQACRGVDLPAAIPYDDLLTSPPSDFFIAYATSPYTRATRNWYITELCKIFETKYTDNDLQRMHTVVNNNVTKHHDTKANYKQQPQIDDRLNRQVWFNRP